MKKGLILRRKKLGLGSCKGIKEASTTGLGYIRNDLMIDADFEGVDYVFRWGCTSTVPVKHVVNTAEAIHTVNDKSGFRMKLLSDADSIIYTPNTTTCLAEAKKLLEFGPVFIRPRKHSQGKKYALTSKESFIEEAFNKIGDGSYATTYLDKKSEFRVFVCQGRVVWVANKIPENPEDVVWNVAQGGVFENVSWGNWNLEVTRAAVEAVRVAGLDFGGVDLVVDTKGSVWIIEINSAPSQTSPYRQSCTAKAFDYICENGKETMKLNNNYSPDNWRHFIHPAIWTKGKEN